MKLKNISKVVGVLICLILTSCSKKYEWRGEEGQRYWFCANCEWSGDYVYGAIHGPGFLSSDDENVPAYAYYGVPFESKDELDSFVHKVANLPNGQLEYFGECDDDGIQGFCAAFSNKKVWIGEYEDGKPNGHCVVLVDGLLHYDGELSDGKKDGYGKLYEKGVLIYEGEFDNDKAVNGVFYDGSGAPRNKSSNTADMSDLTNVIDSYKWDLGLNLYNKMNDQIDTFLNHKVKYFIWGGVFVVIVAVIGLLLSVSDGTSVFTAYFWFLIGWPFGLHTAYYRGESFILRFIFFVAVLLYYRTYVCVCLFFPSSWLLVHPPLGLMGKLIFGAFVLCLVVDFFRIPHRLKEKAAMIAKEKEEKKK